MRPRGDRITSLATMRRQQATLERAVHAAIREYLHLVADAVGHTAITADASGPDVNLNQLDQSGHWPNILQRHILPALGDLLLHVGPPSKHLSTAGALTQIKAWRANWLAQRTKMLVGVPDQITRQIRDAITEDAGMHGPDPRAAASIVKQLINPDAPTWKSRAATIARTEVVAANNQGGLASWGAVSQALGATGAQVLKTWLATEDVATRETHSDIDGTEIPIGETFTVGGSEMTGPGDDNADPAETVNCRCTLTYRVVDADGNDTDAAADDQTDADALTAATEATVTAPTIADTPQAPDDQAPEVAPAGQYPDGTQWAGPLCPVDTMAADGRMLASAGAVVRPLPLPLSFQMESSHGGEEAGKTVIVARILGASVEGGMIVAYGDFLDPGDNFALADQIQAAAQRVEQGLGMVSVDTAPTVIEYAAQQPDGTLVPVDPMLYDGDMDDIVTVFAEWELMGATLVADPAFGTARVAWVDGAPLPGEQGGVAVPMPADDSTPIDPGSFSTDSGGSDAPNVTADAVTFPDGTTLAVGDTVHVTDALGSDSPSEGIIESLDPANQQATVVVEDADDPSKTNSITVDAANLAVPPGTSDGSDDQAPTDSTDEGSGAAPAAAVIAGARFAALEQEHIYPADWFEPVALDGPTRITITDEGRVYGHVADNSTCHIGYANECVGAPSSPTGYAYFHTGDIPTTNGLLAVGKLTVGGGHADLKLGWRPAAEHYDNAGAAVAVVRAHEDEFGIQVTGSLIPTATSDQVSALRRNQLSGDWRPIGGQREMVAALSVNSGGFPLTPRAALAADGRPLALVAAGIVQGDPDDNEPQTMPGVTLPSGTVLSPSDVTVLASAFARASHQQQARDREAGALRARFLAGKREQVRARVAQAVR